MRKAILLGVAVVAVAGLVLAGSPVQTTGTVATNGTSITVPASGSMAYRLQAVVFGATAGTTQTVALVQGGITNQVGAKAVAATDRMLSLTNMPWLFSGEAVRITTTATNGYSAVLVGETAN